MKMIIRLLPAVLLVVSLCAAQGIPPPARLTIQSQVLKEDRVILVRLPRPYSPGARYPVLYMTDGGSGMAHAISSIEFLVRSGRIPDLIVVGIENTDRTRDLTPVRTVTSGSKIDLLADRVSGGADNFAQFLETELIPYVEKNFRTHPHRIFAGHSLGGLFALHLFTTRNALFQAYIAASPSVQWDKASMVSRLRKFLSEHKQLDQTLYLTIADEGGDMQKGFDEVTALLRSERVKGLEWEAVPMRNEDHGSSVLLAYYAGLRKVYQGWNLPVNQKTIAGGLRGVDDHYQRLSARFGYTIPAPELLINRIGYALLAEKRVDEAVTVFKRNTERYPNSANTYDSLADAYIQGRQYALARAAATKAVELGTAQKDPQLGFFWERLEKLTAGNGDGAK